ncbi:MAG: hypothetical protein ACRD16_12785 [Thermoanaerobaculia bacterium]
MTVARSRLFGRAALCAALLAGLILSAGVATTVWSRAILRGGKLRSWVNGRPDKLLLQYDAATSPWPGRVRVRGLRIRGRDPNVEWELRIEECRMKVSLPDLLRRNFHATALDARGLAFRLRQRLDVSRATAAKARDLPPIEGFAPVPVRGRPPTPPAASAKGLWGVQIDRLSAAPVREIWIDSYRYSGTARLAGGMKLRPRRRVSVGPATLEWREGLLFVFGQPAARSMSARISCRIAPFDPSRVRGAEVWNSVSAGADWSGDLGGLEFLNALLHDSPHLSGGKGKIGGLLRIASGKGEARVSLAAEGATARYPKELLTGSVSADLRMSAWRPASGVAETAGSSVKLRSIRAPSDAAREWWGNFEIVSGRLESARPGLRLDARVESRCRDARPLYTVFGVGLPRWTRGLLALDGFSARGAVDFAPGLLRLESLDASGGNFRIRGDYVRRESSKDGAFLVEDGPLRLGVGVEDNGTRLHVFGAEKWFLERPRPAANRM